MRDDDYYDYYSFLSVSTYPQYWPILVVEDKNLQIMEVVSIPPWTKDIKFF